MNAHFGLGAKHALYRKDGKWYHSLKNFPGVLFDKGGYLVIRNRKTYEKNKYFQHGHDLHVKKGISAVPGYRNFKYSEVRQMIRTSEQASKMKAQNIKRRRLRAFDMPKGSQEIRRLLKESYRIIRDTKVSRWVKEMHQHRCQVCGKRIRLSRGNFYSEAHHIRPLGRQHKGSDKVENVICVCPLHHVLLDFGAIALNKFKLKIAKDHLVSKESVFYHNEVIFKKLLFENRTRTQN